MRAAAVMGGAAVRAAWAEASAALAAAAGASPSPGAADARVVAAVVRGCARAEAEASGDVATACAEEHGTAEAGRRAVADACSSAIVLGGFRVAAAAAEAESEAVRQLCEHGSALLSEAGTRLWETHRPWFKYERPGHYVAAWGAFLRRLCLALSPPAGASAEPEEAAAAARVVAAVVASGCGRLAALWGAVRPSRVQMPVLGADAAYAVAAAWPALGWAAEMAAAAAGPVPRPEGGDSHVAAATRALWRCLWVAGVLCGPAAAVASALGGSADAAVDDSAVSAGLVAACRSLGCAWWGEGGPGAAVCDPRDAEHAVRGRWMAPEEEGSGGGEAAPAAPAADGAEPDPEHAARVVHARVRSLGAAGAGKGYVPPRFGAPPAGEVAVPPPSGDFWEPVLGGPRPFPVSEVAELAARRQEVGEWKWPAPTADDAAGKSLITAALAPFARTDA